MLSFVHAPLHVVRPQGLRDELAALADRLRDASRTPTE
jgi:hypothetical protein